MRLPGKIGQHKKKSLLRLAVNDHAAETGRRSLVWSSSFLTAGKEERGKKKHLMG